VPSIEKIDGLFPVIGLLGVPTIAIIIGHFLFSSFGDEKIFDIVTTTFLFTGLAFIGYGFFGKRFRKKRKKEKRHFFLSIGWLIFALYWATQPEFLYWKGGEDIVNASFCAIGVYFLSYIAYHEWLSISRRGNKTLDFLAGITFISAFFYFLIKKTMLAGSLIEVVANQTSWSLRRFGFDVFAGSIQRLPFGDKCVPIYFNGVLSVELILACTGLQSMMIFIGAIIAINDADSFRRAKAFLATVPVIYVLNIFRNMGVIYGMEVLGFNFYLMHNVIGKLGSLIVLIILAFVTFEILPELYDDIVGLADLPKRNGPVEKFIGEFWKKKMKIAKNCLHLILIPFFIGVTCTLLAFFSFFETFIIISIVFFVVTIIFLLFFRDPERKIGNGIVAPADGKIIQIDEIEDSDIGKCRRIAIFMNIYDAHVNRSPMDGIVKSIFHYNGSHLPAFKKESDRNERVITILDTDIGKIKIIQIAGIVARRIISYIKENEKIKKGQRIGMIRFGSRVDLYLPIEFSLSVKVGDRVRVGESIGRY
jgi:phosphatidylserine decarboxylase